jgi:hypothetical protein
MLMALRAEARGDEATRRQGDQASGLRRSAVGGFGERIERIVGTDWERMGYGDGTRDEEEGGRGAGATGADEGETLAKVGSYEGAREEAGSGEEALGWQQAPDGGIRGRGEEVRERAVAAQEALRERLRSGGALFYAALVVENHRRQALAHLEAAAPGPAGRGRLERLAASVGLLPTE